MEELGNVFEVWVYYKWVYYKWVFMVRYAALAVGCVRKQGDVFFDLVAIWWYSEIL